MYYHWYKFLTYLFYPLAPIYLFFRKLNNKEHPERYKEKMSLIKIERENGFLIWFHVASVGEAMSILPLIEYFEKEKNINKILITTITLSSANVLVNKFSSNKKIIHQSGTIFPQVRISFLKDLPLYPINLSISYEKDCYDNIIENVYLLESLNKVINKDADITVLETKIDQLVYVLYGLTEEGIAIVEESMG